MTRDEQQGMNPSGWHFAKGVGLMAVILAIGCSAPSGEASSLLTDDPPPGCVQREAAGFINKFLTAYNGGDAGTEGFFARDGLFQQFVDPPDRIGDEARKRETLEAHFAEQHRRGETLTTSNFVFIGYRQADNMGFFEMTLDRATGQPVEVQLMMECGVPQQRGQRIVSWIFESE
jgi:hypothetical protein